MTASSTNPAALQGWIKSVDPKSGRVFYANHITRKTQWELPDGWREEELAVPAWQQQQAARDDDENEPLPANWEVMHDPTTGKPFYVDHERKITTWTRPKAEKVDTSMSLRPATAASPSSGNAAALARILQQQKSFQSSTRSTYQQEAALYQPSSSHGVDVDLSDSLPKLDFTVKKVPDSLRPTCPACGVLFTMSKRRHHCRLCGDVFCDTCSNHRCTLPLEGPEFETPVRICDFCFKDVDVGNFFSTRRYLTVLHLYDPDMKVDDETGVAIARNVNEALSAFCQDLQQMVQAGDTDLHKKITIPPELLLPVILKHLKHRETADRAVCCIAALLALESLAGDQKADFTTAVYIYGKKDAIDDILDILERTSSDRRSLYVQEQASRTLYYLTESRIIAATTRKISELGEKDKSDDAYGGSDECLDIPRTIRIMLDHSSATQNPNLQRWAAACINNLVVEDQRRATMAVNNMAAIIASGSNSVSRTLEYESCLDSLVSTGGLMILGSLIGADDADIRAHAVSALNATLTSTRAVDASMVALSEMTGGEFGRTTSKEGDIVRAIVAGGGCGSSVSPLLLSAENSVAALGCSLLSSLVTPLLSDPVVSASLAPQYDYRNDQTSSLGACLEASVEIATGSCLPALLSLVREQGASRPLELRVVAMTTLAAVVSSIGEMGRAWAQGAYEEGLERTGAPNKLKEAILLLNEEDVMDTAIQILQSGSGQSLGGNKDTPSSRIRESAGIILGSLTSCSAEAIMTLQNKNILSSLVQASMDASMATPSSIRGDGAPRCQGVLEAVSAVLMFVWQHPSGASNELLDRLIEMIDAGAIPYASRVLNNKLDWDSRDKAVGAMKGRAASCRLLCCLFGVALSNENGIGMRRLMDAVDSDARSYRGSNDGKLMVPSNVIEATLGCLQTASNQARKVIMGGSHYENHYQSALMDLVEASLLAVGSMCGSSIAPGGSEGTLITGEKFLVSRNDPYVGRRKEICNVACDVVVRGGRSGPTLLPTMIVGGFGEGAVLASLRLALAVAQNGTNDQHAKLAMSGIMVPISDLLRSALSRGDIYKFSTSLTLVRFCGPYVAAGQGGGLESVRDAIRVATNVLILPVNPEATLKQMETQETLKSECIVALEALSRNASLWSSISTEALPSIVRYLHTSSVVTGSKSPRTQKTKSGALRAVLQIVQVPSHAVSAAEAHIVDPLCRLLNTEGPISQGDEIPLLALEILHVIAKNPDARRKARFLDLFFIRTLCAVVGKSATDSPSQPADSRADVTFIGLEIIHSILYEFESKLPTGAALQSKDAIVFLDAITAEPSFVRALCSTMLVSTNMALPRHDSDTSGVTSIEIPRIYGSPLIKVDEKCAGYSDTHAAAESLLFSASVYACAIEKDSSETFWETFLLQDLYAISGAEECIKTSATLVAHFLALMDVGHSSFFPSDANKIEDFTAITRPLVRHRLLEALKYSIAELNGESVYGSSQDPYLTSILVGFKVPQICLALWRDPALLDLAFDLIKTIVGQDPDEVLHLFVEGKSAILSLFDLLNLDSAVASCTNVVEIRQFLASILGQLAESGLLKNAVERFDVRSSAIAALAAASLSEEERTPEEDEDMTSNKLSTVLMRCLVDLCSTKENGKTEKNRIQLSQTESAAIASKLGRKLCHMVLSRFLERSKLQQYEMDGDDEILNAPDVAMLCAISQHDESLLILRSIGGLHALSLIAAEGEISALIALKKACETDASVLLEGDTYHAMMNLLCAKEGMDTQLAIAAFELLARLCAGSAKGRNAVASAKSSVDCIARAMEIVSSLVTGSSIAIAGPAPVENEDEDTGDDEPLDDRIDEEQEGEELDSSRPCPEASDEIVIKAVDPDIQELGCSACTFLSALVPTKVGRQTLSQNAIFINALSLVSRASPSYELKFAALTLVVSLAPYVSAEGTLSASLVASAVEPILSSAIQMKATATLNGNRFACAAVNGISIVFDILDETQQVTFAQFFASHFAQVVKNCIVTKATTRDEERAFAGELACSLSNALLMLRGRSFVNTIFTQELITSGLHLVQWRVDPKTSLVNTNERCWDACVANWLTLLSSLLWRPNEKLQQAGINLKALTSTTLMLARPGKAPRKAIDLLSALGKVSEGSDPGAAVAAFHLIDRLFTDEL